MLKPIRLLDTSWKINLFLLLSSLFIYSCYFGHIFLHLNSILSSNTLDSLKNYYTYVYHIQSDQDFLHFSGMNFPYGEHIVYTDCQPILTFFLRLFPFTHNYLIGIMHALLFLSFIISPLIINSIFKLLGLDRFSSFLLALGLSLLAPQFVKINGGHYALAYGCIIPATFYLILSFLKTGKKRSLILLFCFNVLLFTLHPYLGFCNAFLTIVSIPAHALFPFHRNKFLKSILSALFSGLLPLILFRIFMHFTDHHPDRPTEPYGSEVLIENAGSLLAPEFGPFQSLMEFLFPNRIVHYEGHTYLGFCTIVLSTIFILLLPFTFRNLRSHKEMAAVFIGSLFLLFMALGLHNKVFALLNIHSLTFKQLRATCRFAWYFYYSLPLFIIPVLYDFAKTKIQSKKFLILIGTVCSIFFVINLCEANYFFKKDKSSFWNSRNIFSKNYLNQEEKNILEKIKALNLQAIIPLPVFHGGSELYDRLGFNNSMIPSMLYSVHSGLPILSSLMSRTSLSETENSLGLLNSYKTNRKVNESGSGGFFILKTNDELLPDEERLLTKTSFFAFNDTLKFGSIGQSDFLSRKMDLNTFALQTDSSYFLDSLPIVYIPKENRKPFTTGNFQNYEHIYTLDSNRIESGNYYVSLHHFFENKTYHSVACDLIITRNEPNKSEWFYILPLRYVTGFYGSYMVMERKIRLEKKYSYDFMLKGNSDVEYHISDFMLRPEGLTVIVSDKQHNTINNYSTEN
ncbi:MAG: hypothetical protein JNL60_12065 [Bacteroidia bacterium]|nr:hypothetical protein [Bacteroidia bacterium]